MDDLIASTEAEAAARCLEQDILAGVLAPDAKLKIRELKARYGIGASPMREALARLSANGLVQLRGQRGFRVAPVSHQELIDITATRKLVEAEAIQLAIKNATPAWEDEIVASFHVFERQVARFCDGIDKRLDAYEEKHHRFHCALIAACPLTTLTSFCEELYVRTRRYRALNRGYGFSKEAVVSEHRLLMDAVLRCEIPSAVAAARAHIGLTEDLIAQLMQVAPDRPPAGDARKTRTGWRVKPTSK